MTTLAIFVLGLALVFLVARIAGDVRRMATALTDDPARRAHTTLYPVFSECQTRDAYFSAFEATKRSREMESALLKDDKFKGEESSQDFGAEILERMLEVTRSVCESERLWHEHAAMMEANISVVAGRSTREEALARADEQFEVTHWDWDAGATKMRDEWKARLQGSGSFNDPAPRPYSNPWSDRVRQRFPL